MFQFTTTNVINSQYDSTGKDKWTAQAADGDTPASLNVKRVNKFIADNVLAIYKAEAVDGEKAKVTLDLSNVNGVEGDTYRLLLYVTLTQGSSDSRYSNDTYYKGKPFSIDFIWGSDTATTVENLAKVINKYEFMVYGDKQLEVTYSGTCLTIEAMTEYQRFVTVAVQHFNESDYHGLGEYDTEYSLDDITAVDSNDQVSESAAAYFVGKEGFGTFSYLLHNLRLPTTARTDAFSMNQDEAPIPGVKYNQYTIKYCVKRGVLGMNAVGDLVTSATNHVFYVKEDLCEDFEAALAMLGDITEVPAE